MKPRKIREPSGAMLLALALIAAAFVLLALMGCTSTADLRKPAPLYGPGGYKERMLIQRAPSAPLRR